MASISVTTTRVSLVDPTTAKIKTYIAGVSIAAGDPIAINRTTGKAVICVANQAGDPLQFRGIALTPAEAGYAFEVVEDGEVAGFDLSAIGYDVPVFVNATGDLDATGATGDLSVGRVAPLTDRATSKVLRVIVSNVDVA